MHEQFRKLNKESMFSRPEFSQELSSFNPKTFLKHLELEEFRLTGGREEKLMLEKDIQLMTNQLRRRVSTAFQQRASRQSLSDHPSVTF